MTLRERLAANEQTRPASNGQDALALHAYQELKKTMHQTILDRIDLERLKRLTAEQFKHELALLVQRVIEDEHIVLNQHERHSLVLDIQHEMLGFGPLEPLLADPSVSDILVNTCDKVYVERGGRLQLTDVTFHDNAHLMKIIEKIVSRVGRRVDESSPMVDARLPDGSRVNAIIPPLAVDGPILSIRRFAVHPLSIANLLDYKSLTPPMVQVLQALGQAKVNILISGGTGSGKTTLLNVLSGFIPGSERIVTIEDAAELQLRQPHVVRLETRPPNIEGKGEVSQRALVRNALRMRPDRIILGEVRGAEALDMLQAMNTGHEGSLATIHSNTARDALSRLENMVGMASVNLTPRATRQQICSAVTVVMQVSRLTDGARKLVSLQEVTGMEGDIIAMHEIFRFEQTGVDKDGKVLGHFCATGVRPRFTERLRMFGAAVPDSVFDPDRIYE
ncbi:MULTISPECIES: CpaF family protein [unclassified Janthinobacterium]|jgi:pilus assembly protein CpaF|uniref:CpaF family protein n=1 Tax=unclassified Janthinobacterium TaxID=2610881 RepID=UPI0016159246|nr:MULTISPECIES: CpaF family protein [unclassified Janthinobacterium]MBB5605696.1 pilus assembly protein CpaF [Janthinobacterium sp. S3T4]MBB5611385.1 pilus assembly protein CpaF [Janthinobacterium sp. S3M3]